ncbi:MAG: DUF362 domain-containing protein [Pseudomonadota bacterium]
MKIDGEKFEDAILKSLRLIDYNFPRDARNIVIKPNLCYYLDWTTGYTTDPNFVASLATVLRKNISKDMTINVVESDASAMKCKHAFKMLGYEKMAQRWDLNLVNLSDDEFEEVRTTVNNSRLVFKVPSTIRNADLLINVTKMKYSRPSVKMTCALKNIFGCNPYPQKYRYHYKLPEVIVGLNKIMKFHLNIIDGNVVYGEGTSRLGLVMASRDIVAIDAACAKIMRISPRRIKYLRLAEKENVGISKFEARGVSLEYFASRFPRQKYLKTIKDQVFYYLEKFGLTGKLGID